MQATYRKYILNFKRPSGTSRGVLDTKETWFLKIAESGRTGIGECGILRTLSIDDRPDYEEKLKWVCENISLGPERLWDQLQEFPSIQFGVEMAFRSLNADDPFVLFPSEFTKSKAAIPINGLVWMGDERYMKSQISDKIRAGFSCIKIKVGAIDFEAELDLLKYIREEYGSENIEIRVDANGAFHPAEALEKLKRISEYNVHSIEQPVKSGQWEIMEGLCRQTPVPIVLDEELLGIVSVTRKQELLQMIKPQYIIFKPSLIGGFRGTQEWMDLAETEGVGWWATSALESNIGLNAISQWVYTKKVNMAQGLGTGALYTNNIDSPLEVQKGTINYQPGKTWEYPI